MKLTIRHQISIALPEGTGRAVQHLLLTPRSGPTQTIGDWKIEMPGMAEAAGFSDAYGNRAHLVAQLKPPEELVVVAAGSVETHDRNGVLGRPQGEPVPGLFLRATALTQPDAQTLSAMEGHGGRGRIALLHALMEHVGLGPIDPVQAQENPAQTQNMGEMSQSMGDMTQTLEAMIQTMDTPLQSAPRRKLTGPDMAHAFIGAARALGIPARYVTGYLAAEDEAPTFFHAWAEAFDDGLGWIAFDPLLQVCPTERHVRLAVGLDATSATPVRAVPAGEPPMPSTLMVEVAQ